jgi:NAD(P)-dependent dehydrogenase (short-subunit alcohol dehydrogenase family)
MNILIIGGKGTIGSAVAKELSQRHKIITAGRHNCDLHCDMTSEESIHKMFKGAGTLHAVIITSGSVIFDDFEQMTWAKYHSGIHDKLFGQVNIVLIGRTLIQDKGSFTLTTGILSRDPIRTGSSATMVNRALEGFVIGSAIEMPRQIRINAISPTLLVESVGKYGPYFQGFDPVPAAKVALAYSKSVEGLQTGQIYEVLA